MTVAVDSRAPVRVGHELAERGVRRLEIDGETYAWTGEGFYDSEALEPVDVSTSEAYFMTDKYNLRLDVVYVMPGEDNTIYYGFFGSETSEYLIMEKLD